MCVDGFSIPFSVILFLFFCVTRGGDGVEKRLSFAITVFLRRKRLLSDAKNKPTCTYMIHKSIRIPLKANVFDRIFLKIHGLNNDYNISLFIRVRRRLGFIREIAAHFWFYWLQYFTLYRKVGNGGEGNSHLYCKLLKCFVSRT